MRQREPWPGRMSAVRPGEGPLAELSTRDHRRMRRAMMRGRPLPPRLARAAVQYAPKLHNQAWLVWPLLFMGLLYAMFGAVQALAGGFVWWLPVSWEIAAAIWLAGSGWWFWTARRAGRAARTGHWPEQPEGS